MKALILGSRGFLGGHLYSKLKAEGHEVIGLDNNFHVSKNVNDSLVGDIRNKQLIDELVSQVDIVFLLAAIIHVDYANQYPEETIDVNVKGTLNVLESCKKYGKKLVFASSSEVYGSSQSEFMGETHQMDAQGVYAASKASADRLCKAYIDTYGMDIAILRNFNTFGPYQNDGGEGKSYGAVIGIFTRAALRNEPLRIFGDGEQRRDYMYITDALKGYEIASKYTGVLNIGSGATVSINEIAEKITKLTNSKSEIVHIEPRPGEVQRLCADISRAKSLGFLPETNFDIHLKMYIDWFIKNGEPMLIFK